MSDNLEGCSVGRYVFRSQIGKGSSAIIYKAHDKQINREVACKVLKSNLIDNPLINKQFIQEAKVAASLSHPNIPIIHDVFSYHSTPAIIMELIEGQNLGELLLQETSLKVEHSLNIAIQLAEALDYAHGQGCIHCDIKPDNVIVLKDSVHIKVIDFGNAKIEGSGIKDGIPLGKLHGTPRYMSPEQCLRLSIDARSDLFSLGAVLYEMLSGEKAFDANTMGGLVAQITQTRPPHLCDPPRYMSTGIYHILKKLMHKSPVHRYQTAKALIKDLQQEVDTVFQQRKRKQKV